MRFLILSFLLVTSACAMNSKKDSERALLHLSIGTAHLENRNYPAALSELLQAEALDRDNPIIQNNLGLAYYVREKYSIAEKHMRNAVELDPKYTEARNNLGRILIDMGLYDEALKELKVAAEDLTYQFPEKSYANIGWAYFKKAQYKQAKNYLKKALELNKENCFTYNYYGRTLFESEEYRPAANAFDKATRLCKNITNFDEPHYYSALSYYKLGEIEQSTALFEEVIRNYKDGAYAKKAHEMLKLISKLGDQ